MNVKLIAPFTESVLYILPQLGISGVQRSGLIQTRNLNEMNVTATITLSEQITGQVRYSMAEDTAKKLASTMMLGMPVEVLDEMAQSAIAEMVNMITGHTAVELESLGIRVDISPPNVVVGKSLPAMNDPCIIEMLTDAGPIAINIALIQ